MSLTCGVVGVRLEEISYLLRYLNRGGVSLFAKSEPNLSQPFVKSVEHRLNVPSGQICIGFKRGRAS